MEDLELQLLDLLKKNWTTEKDTVLFHRNMRRVEGIIEYPNLIIKDLTNVDKWSTEGTGECMALVMVRTRIKANDTSNKAVETTKELKHKLREEIYRILAIANDVNDETIKKPSTWEWAYVTRRRNGDNFDVQPAILGEDLNIAIAYQR